MKCIVTGATGFIGTELCQRLAGEGAEVLAIGRSAARSPGVDLLTMDLTCEAPTAAQLAGADVLFHLAGIAHQQASAAACEALNVRATEALADSALEAGVRCFIYLSSVKAAAPEASHYASSKYRAEQALRRLVDGRDMRLVILRPALVYGPGVKGNLGLLGRAVEAGLPRPPALGGRSMIARSDLVELMLDIARDPPAGIHTWTVTDGEVYSTRRLYDALRAASGRPPGRAWPEWIWRLVCGLLDLRGVSPGYRERLFGTEVHDGSQLLAARCWRPRLRFEDVAAQVLRPELG